MTREESGSGTERPSFVITPSWGELIAVLLIAVAAAGYYRIKQVVRRVR